MGLNFGEYVEENPVGEISVDVRFTMDDPQDLSYFMDDLHALADGHGIDVSYPVMEAMVVPDLDNGGG